MTEGIVFSIGEFAVHDRPGTFTMPGMFLICKAFHCAVRAGGQVPGGVARRVRALLPWCFPVCSPSAAPVPFGLFSLVALGSLIFAIELSGTKDNRSSSYGKELTK